MSDAAGDVASKVAAGAASGAFAAFLLNPTELIKTRFMARGPELRNSAWACAAGIARERGVAGLWRGAGMSTARSAILTASQCAAYDGAKSFVRGTRRSLGPENSEKSDDLFTHLCASMLTGLVTTTVTNPVDMIKTQLYVSSPGPNSSKRSSKASPGRRGGGGARRAEARGTARVHARMDRQLPQARAADRDHVRGAGAATKARGDGRAVT